MKALKLLTDTHSKSILKDERGATVLEYIILACLVIGACFIAVTTLGTSTNDKFTEAGTQVGSMKFGQ